MSAGAADALVDLGGCEGVLARSRVLRAVVQHARHAVARPGLLRLERHLRRALERAFVDRKRGVALDLVEELVGGRQQLVNRRVLRTTAAALFARRPDRPRRRRCRGALRPAGQDRAPTADVARVASSKVIAESPGSWRADRAPCRPAPRSARARQIASSRARAWASLPDRCSATARYHDTSAANVRSPTASAASNAAIAPGKIVEEQPRHALIEEDLDRPGIAARRARSARDRQSRSRPSVRVESRFEIRQQLVAVCPSCDPRHVSAPMPSRTSGFSNGSKNGGTAGGSATTTVVPEERFARRLRSPFDTIQTSERDRDDARADECGTKPPPGTRGTRLLAGVFHDAGEQPFLLVCAQRRAIFTESFRERSAHRACGQVFRDRSPADPPAAHRRVRRAAVRTADRRRAVGASPRSGPPDPRAPRVPRDPSRVDRCSRLVYSVCLAQQGQRVLQMSLDLHLASIRCARRFPRASSPARSATPGRPGAPA